MPRRTSLTKNLAESRPTGADLLGARGTSHAASDMATGQDPCDTVPPRAQAADTVYHQSLWDMHVPPANAAFADRDPCGCDGRSS